MEETVESMIDYERLEALKPELQKAFANGGPIRWFTVDNFLKDGYVEQLAAGYPAVMARAAKDPNAPKKHRHVLRKIGVRDPAKMEPIHRRFFEEIQSPRFLKLLEEITGISPLYRDDDLEGGGLHEIYRGGFLNVHTDFNFHPTHGWHRKLNILFYLNPDWKDEWEGHLELRTEDLNTVIARIAPLANRMAIFETSEISYHGHPIPLNVPEGMTRKSMAAYYYTDWPEGLKRREKTNYRLVPWQVEAVERRIGELEAQGVADQEIVAALAPEYQETAVVQVLKNYRAAQGRRAAVSTKGSLAARLKGMIPVWRNGSARRTGTGG